MRRRQVFRAQASKSQTGSSSRRFTSSGPVLPFNPSSIAGCQLWLDAADTSSILLSGSSNVSIWFDKSNTGTTATPTRGATANQITYVTVDGYRGIYINNNASVLYNSSTYSQLTVQSNFQNTTDYSIFAVVNLSNVTSGELQTIYGNVRGASGERTPNFGAGATLEFNLVGENRMINSSFIGSGRLQTALISSSSALTAYTNTTAYASVTNGLTRPSTDVGPLPSIGGPGSFNDNRFANGYFHEILVYNSVLTTIQRQKVEGYLAWKWGLQTSLPSNHPYKGIAPTYEVPVFVPTLIMGNQLWLDGADPAGTGTPPANGATISPWVDKATGKNGTANGTSTYITGGGVNFTGSSYFINQNFAHNLSQRSIFIVMQERRRIAVAGVFSILPNSTSATAFPGNDYSNPSGLSVETAGPMNFNGNIMNGGSYSSGLGNPTLLVKAIYNDNMNGTAGSGYLNGTNATNVTAGYTAETGVGYTVSGRWQGGSVSPGLNLDGIIYEILYFNRALTPSQRQRVEGYLAQKWGLQSSLPANHPYKTIAPTGIPMSITIQSLSALFSPSSKALSIPSKSSFTLGTNNHTIEFWFYQTNRTTYDITFSYGDNPPVWTGTSTYIFQAGNPHSTCILGNGAGGWAVELFKGGNSYALNTWHHFAIVRNGTTFTLYINGTSHSTATSSVNIGPSFGSMVIGSLTSTGHVDGFTGYISNFRFVNGTAVYTSNFTPPTSPLTAIPNTQVLIQGLVDRSPNAFTVTNNGSVALSTSISPFV